MASRRRSNLRRMGGTGGGGAPAAPTPGAPANRQVVTTGVAESTSCTSLADSSVDFYVDGVSVATMTPGLLGAFTYTWTPGSIGNVVVTFVGNVTGASSPITVTIDAANLISQNITTYTQSGTTTTAKTGVIYHPLTGLSGAVYETKASGSGSARRLFYIGTVTGAQNVQKIVGLDVWVGIKPGSVTNALSWSPGSGAGIYDVALNQNSSAACYSCVVEGPITAPDGIVWQRVQYRRLDNATSASTNCYLDLMRDTQNTTYTLSAGEATASGIYLADIRWVDDVSLPFLISDKMAIYEDTTASAALSYTGAKQFYHKSRNIDSETNMAGGPGGISVRLIYPTGYDPSAGTGKLLLILKAQTDTADTTGGYASTWTAAKDSVDYANTYGTVVAVIDERPSEGYWAGKFDTGNKDMVGWYNDVWLPWMIRYQGISSSAEYHRVVGFSKGGNAAIMFKLLYPNNWGYAGAADAAFLNAYPSNNAGLSYDSAGTYNSHDPYQILTSNLDSVNDKARIVITGGITWNADLAAMKALLDANSVLYTYYTVAWAAHHWGNTGGINTVWTPDFIDAVMAL